MLTIDIKKVQGKAHKKEREQECADIFYNTRRISDDGIHILHQEIRHLLF